MVREWLGAEDAIDNDGTVTLDRLKAEFDEHDEAHNGRGGPYESAFEIGGVSIERVVSADWSSGEPCVCGCVLHEGHAGPHEFESGRRWLWEMDMACSCAHCRRCESDYCTVYWRKPVAPR